MNANPHYAYYAIHPRVAVDVGERENENAEIKSISSASASASASVRSECEANSVGERKVVTNHTHHANARQRHRSLARHVERERRRRCNPPFDVPTLFVPDGWGRCKERSSIREISSKSLHRPMIHLYGHKNNTDQALQ